MLLANRLRAGGVFGGGAQLVGHATSATTTYTEPSVSLTALSGGVGSSAMEGDFVLGIASYCGINNAPGEMQIREPVGFSYLVDRVQLGNGTTQDSFLSVFYKFMPLGNPPDTVVRTGYGYGSTGTILHVRVYRGIDPTLPFTAPLQTAGGTDVAPVDPPGVTPGSGSFIIVSGGMACGSAFSASSSFSSSDLSNFVTSVAFNANNQVVCGYGDSLYTTNPSALVGTSIPASPAGSHGSVTLALPVA